MAPYSYGLRVATADDVNDGPAAAGLGDELQGVAGAGLTVNHALLAGEALGVPADEAARLLSEVHRAAALALDGDGLRLLFADDVAVLRDGFGAIRDALDGALDRDGRPVGATGDRLAGSPRVELDERGRVVFRSRHLLAADLADSLDALVRFLDAAAQRGYGVVLE